MSKYDESRLTEDMEKRKKALSSLSDAQLKKEASHVHTLLESSLPTCLRKRTEKILSSKAPTVIDTELERFTYEARWFQLMLDYEKLVSQEAKKRKIA
jgi:hypothetical protein